MQRIKTTLDNGYSLNTIIGLNPERPHDVKIEIYDEDDIFDRELVRITDFIEEEGQEIQSKDKFAVQVFIEEDNAHEFILNWNGELVDNRSEEDSFYEEFDGDLAYEDESDNFIEDKIATKSIIKYGDTGEEVKKIQTRLKVLNYFNGNIGGNYLSITKAAVEAFQLANGLQVDGECDEETYNRLFSNEAVEKEIKMVEGSTVEPAHGTAKVMDWWKSDIQKIFAKGTIAKFTDIETGLAWQVRRRGGTNHADFEPLTAADTATFKKAAKKWSWDRRAIFVTINGVNYAASINCMPHGNGSIKDNNYNGHSCCHFLGSKTHCSNKPCKKHQAAIKKAASTTLP